MGNNFSATNTPGVDSAELLNLTSAEYMKIITESKGGVYGSHLEFKFDEVLKTKEFDFSQQEKNAQLTERIRTKSPETSRSENSDNSEDNKPAPSTKSLGIMRRFSQVIIDADTTQLPQVCKESLQNLKETCQHALEIVRTHNSFHFLIAVDGTPESEAAFQVAMSLRKKFDRLTLFHVYSESEQTDEKLIKRLYRQKAVLLKYETMLMTSSNLNSNQYVFTWKSRDDDDTNRDVLIQHLKDCDKEYQNKAIKASAAYDEGNNLLNESSNDDTTKKVLMLLETREHPPDFVVLSSPGRRSASTKDRLFQNVNEMALYGITTSTILVRKSPSTPVDKAESSRMGISIPISKKYVMAVNHSDTSKQGLQMLFTLIHPHDSLELVYVFKEFQESQSCKIFDTFGQDKLREIQAYYEKQLAFFGPSNSVFTVINTSKFRIDTGAINMNLSISAKKFMPTNSQSSQPSARKSSNFSLSGISEHCMTPIIPRVLPSLNLGFSTPSIDITISSKNIPTARDGGVGSFTNESSAGSTKIPFLRDSSVTGGTLITGRSMRSAKSMSARDLIASAMDSPTKETTTMEPTFKLKYDNDVKQLYYSQISSIVVDHVNVKLAANPPDFFVVAPSVANKSTLTESFLALIDCNIILVKSKSI